MPWFSVHTIIAYQKDDCKSSQIYGNENIYLIEAESHEDAQNKIFLSIQEEANAQQNDLTIDGISVKIFKISIRKSISIFNDITGDNVDPPISGSELSYLDLEFCDEENFEAYINGEPFSANFLS